MQRIINIPDMVVEDMLKGFVKAHPELVKPTENPRVLKSNWAGEKGRVGVVTGGGSGHKPAFIGYCGRNMCDAIAVGEVFSSPTAKAFYDAFREADGGVGVACLYGNYAGDNMNVRMAIELAEDDDIEVKKVIANDDVASAPRTEPEKRRGVAGEVFMWKIGGAKAAKGGSLDEVIAAARDVGVKLSEVTSVSIGERGESGRAKTLLISGKEVSAPAFRIAIGSTKMRSCLFESLRVEDGKVQMRGRGYGHGVGMSQWGAYAMAKEGKTAEEIVTHYFAGVMIDKAWE